MQRKLQKPVAQRSTHGSRGRRSSTQEAKTAAIPQDEGGSADDEAVAPATTPTHHLHHGDRDLGDDEATLPHRYMKGPQVCQRYAISDMSLWRWLQDTELAFPQPALRIRDRRYWLEADLVAWERSHIEWPQPENLKPAERVPQRATQRRRRCSQEFHKLSK